MIPLVSFNMHCKPNYNNYQNLYHMYHSDFIAVSIFINYIYNKYYNSFSKYTSYHVRHVRLKYPWSVWQLDFRMNFLLLEHLVLTDCKQAQLKSNQTPALSPQLPVLIPSLYKSYSKYLVV